MQAYDNYTLDFTDITREWGTGFDLYSYTLYQFSTIHNGASVAFPLSGTTSIHGTVITQGAPASKLYGITVYNSNIALTNNADINLSLQDTASCQAASLSGITNDDYSITNNGHLTFAAANAAGSTTGTATVTGLRAKTVTNTATLDLNAANYASLTAYGIETNTTAGSAVNSGAINITSTDIANVALYGMYGASTVNAFSNTGTITVRATGATSPGSVVYGVYLAGASAADTATFTNSGVISVLTDDAYTGAAYAIYAAGYADIVLAPGSSITGAVGSASNTSSLTNNAADLDFALLGTWGTVTQSGTGIWTLGDGTSATMGALNINAGTLKLAEGASATTASLSVASQATLGLTAAGQTTAQLTVTGTDASAVNIAGAINVYGTASGVGATSVLLDASASGADLSTVTINNANPNFSTLANIDTTGGTLSVTSTYAPTTDESSQGLQGSLVAAQGFTSVATSRSMNLLTGVLGASASSAADGSLFGELQQGKPVLLASAGDTAGLFKAPSAEPSWALYLEPVFGKGHRDVVNGQGYNSDFVGMEFGADRFIDRNLLIGVTGGIGTVDINFTGDHFYSQDSEQQTLYILGAYAGYKWGNFCFTDLLSDTYVKHSSIRHADATDYATGTYDSNILSNELIAAYTWDMTPTWSLLPHVGYKTSWLTREAFSETNSANAIQYDAYEKTFHEASLGVRATGHFSVQDHTVEPYVGIGMTQSLTDNDMTMRQNLVGTTTSASVTTSSDDTHATAEMGVSLAKGPFSLTFGYENLSSENDVNHSFSALLRWQF